MTRLLRHDQTVPREEDGAAEFRISASISHSKSTSSPYWFIRTWLNYLQRGGGAKKRYQYCVDPRSDTILYLRAIQCHSGGNILILHCNQFGSSHDLHFIIQSGLILGGKDVKKERHVMFFTALNSMFIDHYRDRDYYDVTNPRIAVYKHTCKKSPKHSVLV